MWMRFCGVSEEDKVDFLKIKTELIISEKCDEYSAVAEPPNLMK